jgi:hypothetical protein
MSKFKRVSIQGSEIAIMGKKTGDFISLTDMAKSQMQEAIIIKWLSLKNTIEYLGEWEALYNPDFNYTEFGTIRNAAGSNNFVLSVKQWIERTGAIGVQAAAGRYGGTYAHTDIAFHFGMWISPRFQLLLVKEYQRLKADEASQLKLEWDLQRALTKVNYRIHTEAIKENLIPDLIHTNDVSLVYATEADVLNRALFGKTAADWRKDNTNKGGNISDSATLEQLVVLTNLESINALLIQQGVSQEKRLLELNRIAIKQLQILLRLNTIDHLRSIHPEQ